LRFVSAELKIIRTADELLLQCALSVLNMAAKHIMRRAKEKKIEEENGCCHIDGLMTVHVTCSS
jgi:hypothetical protein